MRAAAPGDAAAVVTYLNRVGGESDNLLFGENGFPISEEGERAHIEARRGGCPSTLLLGFADDELVSVGSVEVPQRTRLAHTGELALSVSKSHWGQGVATAMMAALLTLYRDLLDETPLATEEALPVWRRILSGPDQYVILGEVSGEIVASCVLVVAANLTRGGRPWAIVENVVTAKAHRRKGYGLALLEEAKRIALCMGCYKIMLLTGRKDEGTLTFYRRAGYNQNDKTAFIQRF